MIGFQNVKPGITNNKSLKNQFWVPLDMQKARKHKIHTNLFPRKNLKSQHNFPAFPIHQNFVFWGVFESH